MFKVLILTSLAAIACAQYPLGVDYNYNGVPNPYQFSYSAPSEGGASSHQESGDGSGRVTGSYTVNDEDGRSRVVEYVADEGGFRASITTNEPGTSNQAPADVTISSSAEEAYAGGIQYGGAGGYAPAPVAPLSLAAAPAAGVAPGYGGAYGGVAYGGGLPYGY